MKSSILKTLVLSLFLAPVLSLAQTWTAPAQNAPAGNTSAPINVSSVDQVKSGGISVGALSVTGNAALTGANSTLTIGGVSFRSVLGSTLAIGSSAGSSSSATYGNFIGANAGRSTSIITNSNFIGTNAGWGATNAGASNFIGAAAGMSAASAGFSNFIGGRAGLSATQASNSNFIGSDAGMSASNAANSIFIGLSAGSSDTVNNVIGGSNRSSILIGNYTSTGGFSNSIAIGQGARNSAADQLNVGRVIYATGIASSTAASASPIAEGKVGIGTATPTATLDVAGSVKGTSVCIGSDCRSSWPSAAPAAVSAKAWFTWSSAGGLLANYGVTSVVRDSNNRPVVTLSSPMSSSNYAVICNGRRSVDSNDAAVSSYSKSTTTFRLQGSYGSGEDALVTVDCVVFGN